MLIIDEELMLVVQQIEKIIVKELPMFLYNKKLNELHIS